MARKYPIVLVDGVPRQLPPDDTIDGFSVGQALVGSGLVGGGDLSTGDKRFDVALAATTSGLIFVGDSLGLTGEDEVVADTALASGNAALTLAEVASISGVAAQSDANTALASGNAALYDAVNFQSATSLQLVAGSDLTAGAPVGLDDSGKVQQVRYVRGFNGFEVVSTDTGVDRRNYHNRTIYIASKDLFVTGFSQASTNYGGVYVSQISGDIAINETPIIYDSRQTLTSVPIYHPPSDKVVLAHGGNGTANGVRVCTLSGTTISVGGSGNTDLEPSYPTYIIDGVYNPSGQVITYQWLSYIGSLYYCRARSVLAVSGDSAYFGSITNVGSNTSISNNTIAYDTLNNRYLHSYNANVTPQSGVLSTSVFNGNTLTLSPVVALSGGLHYYTASVFDESVNKTFYIYKNPYNPPYLTVIPVDTSSTTPVLGVSDTFGISSSGINEYPSAYYDSSNQRVLVAYTELYDSYRPVAAQVKISGSNGAAVVSPYYLASSGVYAIDPGIAWSTNSQKALVTYGDVNNNYSGVVSVLDTSNGIVPTVNGLNNYIGSSRETVSSGASVNVLLPKANDLEHSSLSVGSFYYVDPSSSGYTTASGIPSGLFIDWNSNQPWGYVAKSVSSSGLFLLETL